MIEFKFIENRELASAIATFRTSSNKVVSNFFGLTNHCHELGSTQDSLIIRKKESGFYRLYYLTKNESELLDVLSGINDGEYVVNIPTKTPIDGGGFFLNECGFELIGEYSRFYNRSIGEAFNKLSKLSEGIEIVENCELAQYALACDQPQIMDLLRENFSVYTDHLPEDVELTEMIEKKHVLINRYDGNVCGVEIFTPTSQVCYGNVWIDTKGLGVFLSLEVYRYLISNNIKVMNFWVNNANKKVIKYHKMLGSVPDGLIDYSFLKK